MKYSGFIFTFLICLNLFSCFEIVDVDLKDIDGRVFPYIELIYNSNGGWETVISTTKNFNKKNSDVVELEYIKLYEEGTQVYSGMEDSLNYSPVVDKRYSVKVKLKGYEEIESDKQIYNAIPDVDTCLVLVNTVLCTWTNDDPEAGYYVQVFDPSGNPGYYKRPDIVKSLGDDLPERL